MFWLGLTGGIATGKSRVSQILVELGESVIDADHIARVVVAKGSRGLTQLQQVLGLDILTSSGELDRKVLGERLFGDKKTKVQVESILHPLIREEVEKQKKALQSQGVKRAFYDIPLLFETQQQKQFDAVIVVYCPPKIQLERLINRDGISEMQAQQKIQNQISIEIKRQQADYIVDNSKNPDHLRVEVENMLKWLDQNLN